MVGIYLTGHPLQDYKLELNYFCDINLKVLNEKLQELPEREFSFIGLANSAANLESRRELNMVFWSCKIWKVKWSFVYLENNT